MAGDPLWGNVITSMQFNGTNGAGPSSMIDGKGHTFTGTGSPIISTSWGITGGSSLYLNGSSQINTPFFSGINFGTSNFEINCWVYNTTRAANPSCILDCSTDTPAVGWRFAIGTDGSVSFYSIGLGQVSTAANKVPVNTQTHLAVTRVSGTLKIWVNGVESASGTLGNFNTTGQPLCFGGAIGTYWPFYGYIDRAEIIAGAVRHTSTFTPETTPLVQYRGELIGTVTDEYGISCSRVVRAYDRATGDLQSSTTSDPITGAYVLTTQTMNQAFIIGLDDEAGAKLNAIVKDRLTPV